MSCFALLDDAGSTAANPVSRLYTGYLETLACDDASQWPFLLAQMQQALAQGKHALALFDYELGAQLHGIAARPEPAAVFPDDSPCVRAPHAQILLFADCRKLSAAEVEGWLAAQDSGAQPAGIAALRPSVDERQFDEAIARIHAYLEAGDIYQVNYTYRLRFEAFGAPLALYRRLRASQPVPFGAMIALPEGSTVLSFSPELFVRNEGGVLTARPMKGTAAAGAAAAQDAERAQALAADPKNRAENLMIVDLLRNDLGRIARPGTVRVPQLFDVRRYGQVLQMTSTICARPREEVDLAQLLTALYPCGSITGAPKRRAMQIIRELEPDARSLYTGAIGWCEAAGEGARIGDFCLSVPIRTLLMRAPQGGVRLGEMGVGAGIVHDSEAANEYAECLLKARFLTSLPQDFELLETMQASSAGCPYMERHLDRLRGSARYFGFAWNEAVLREQLRQAGAALSPGPHRLRLALRQDGQVTLQSAPLVPLAQPVRLLLAPQPTRADDLFLRHKTTQRQVYDAAWKQAEAAGAFDMLFFNEAGELTEGARSNVFIKLRGRWLTPPLSAGLLPGVMRAVLLDDPAWQATEAPITVADLCAAEEVVVCNALRGAMRAIISFSN